MIPDKIVQKVIDDVDIVEVISEYLPLQQRGTSMVGLCPFHPDTNPSMHVSREKKVFNCFSCNTKGTVVHFVSKYENISFEQATLKLAQRIGLKIDYKMSPQDVRKQKLYDIMKHAYNFYQFYLHNSEEGLVAKKYLAKRGLNDDILNQFQIGLAPSDSNYLHLALNEKSVELLDQIELGLVREGKNGVYDLFRSRILFTIQDERGNIVGFSGRRYLENDISAKYINSPETLIFQKNNILYNLHNATVHAKRLDKIFVLEGFLDVIASDIDGLKNTVATMGTAFTQNHANQLAKITKNIVLCFDGDDPGINASKKATEIFAGLNILPQIVALPNELDPDDYLQKYGRGSLNQYLNNNASSVYEYLFQEAQKSLVLDDLLSIERFKNTVFEFLKISRSQTIQAYFINKMAELLNISIDVLTKDFGSISGQRYTRQREEKQTKKVQAIPIKFEMALNYIIYRSFQSKESYQKVIELINELDAYFPPAYLSYKEIINEMNQHYLNDEFKMESFLNVFHRNETINKVLNEINKKKISYVESETQFNDCLNTIRSTLTALNTSSVQHQNLEDVYDEKLGKKKKTTIINLNQDN